MNRITGIAGTTATLQFPYLGALATGTATINVDTVELDADVITVLEPVRVRNTRHHLRAASSREDLVGWCQSDGYMGYFIESAVSNGTVKLRMMLSGYATSDMVIEFQAKTSLGTITAADIYTGTPGVDPGTAIPVPAQFIESIFLPIALGVFFSTGTITNYDVPSLRNEDAPALIRAQEQTALQLLALMVPQSKKPVRLMPELSTFDTRGMFYGGRDYQRRG
jgi:hypothetical protein